MAMSKRVKTAGSLYKGYKITISAAAGTYTQDISFASGAAINGATVIPDEYGVGDYWGLTRLNASNELVAGDGTLNATKGVFGETVYNVGANASVELDFACLELFQPTTKLRFSYENVAGVAMTVYLILEIIR